MLAEPTRTPKDELVFHPGQGHPLPPAESKPVQRYDFGETVVGKSRRVALELLSDQVDDPDISLAERIRRFVFDRENRAGFVEAAFDYLKGKGPSLKRDYDVVVVGAGLHAASFVYTLRKQHPSVSVLVVEQTSSICSTFARLGDSLVLNSPTFSKVGLNSNVFPGHFIQLSDFDELAHRPFPTAKHLYELATLVLFHADAEIAFGFDATAITRSGDGYLVDNLDQSVQARSVVIANGLGAPASSTFAKNGPSPRIFHGDEFIAAYFKDSQFPERLRDRRIAIAGAGDTANCVMECLLPLVYPHSTYGFPKEAPFLPSSVVWIGQQATDIQEYYFANKLRYCHSGGVIEFFWQGDTPFDLSARTWSEAKSRIECSADRLLSVEDTGESLELQAACVILRTRLRCDLLVDCTGRANPLSETLLQRSYEFVEGDITFYGGQWDDRLEHFVASPRLLRQRRIACRLAGERVFFLGSAGPLGELIDDSEARNGALLYQEQRTSLTNSKWSLEHTLPRTAAFAEKFVEVTASGH
ncbi:MAG: hypothetical protein AAFX94_01580 [Myxococcota bacterium]